MTPVAPFLLAALCLPRQNGVDAKRVERLHRAISASPRLAGSKEDMRAAAWVKARLLEAGLRVEEEEYDVWLSRPVKASLKLVADKPKDLPLVEQGFAWDRDSYNGKRVPAHTAYSPSGKVTAQVVYANYGLPEDYRELAGLGVDVRDRIVIVRYGKSFRGVKLKLAEEHGAGAILLYTDPADAGYVKGDIYPRGPMSPETGIQRGSALYLFEYPGDPLTPGEPALPGVKRLRREAARSLPKVTALPIPWAAADPILRALAGPNVPAGWQGGLPFAYHTGPGPATVALEVENEEKSFKIKNVFGVLEGKSGADGDFVLAGNHRDSWVNGAIDPASGTAAMLEAAYVLGARAKGGWRPDMTIRFASWDGEEYGVIGSTEYGENHTAFLGDHLVAYVNADSVVSGPSFGASATPALRGFARQVAAQVDHPDTGRPLAEGWDKKVKDLGGGSDFMVFVHRLGIPCVSFGLTGPSGVYHSAYDTHWFVQHRIDPGFRYHATIARVLVAALGGLADATTDAYDPAASFRDCAAFLAAHEEALDAESFAKTAELAKRTATQAAAARKSATPARTALGRIGRAWIDEQGLFGRPWFRNLLVAPGRRTGYAAQRFPGLAEAVEDGDAARATRELGRIRARLEAARTRLGALAGDGRNKPPKSGR